MQPKYEVGTLIEDMGKIGVIAKIFKHGALNSEMPLIKWRLNYEIVYQDSVVTIMGEETLIRLQQEGKIKILNIPN